MNRTTLTLALTLGMLLLLVACASPEVDKRLADIEQQMQSQPDSALAHIQELSLQHRITHPRQRAWHALLHAQALDKNFIDSTNDSIINIAVEYYEAHTGDTERLFYAYYYKARILENGGNLHGAIDFLTKADVLTTQFDNDFAKGLLYARIGKLYKDCFDYDKALLSYRLAHDYYEEGNIMPHLFYIKFKLGELLLYNKHYEDALKYLLPYKDWCFKNDQSRYRDCLILLAFLYESTNNIVALSEIVNDDCFDNVSDINISLSKAFLAACNGEYVKAWDWLNKAQSESNTSVDTLNLNFYKFRILKLEGDYKSALSLHEHLFYMQDSLTRVQLQQPLVSVQRDFYQNQMLLKELQIRHNQYLYISASIIILISIIAISLLVRQHILRQRAKIHDYIAQANNLNQRLNDRENTISDMSKQINLLYQELSDSITLLCQSYYNAEECDNSRKKDIYKNIQAHFAKLHYNNAYYEKFEKIINQNLNDVMSIARRELTSLSERDFQLLCYFYARFAAKDISLLTGYSVNNVYVKKNRIKKLISQLPQEKIDILMQNL